MKNNAMLSIGILMKSSIIPQHEDPTNTSSVKVFLPRIPTTNDREIIKMVDAPEYTIVAYNALGSILPVQPAVSCKIKNY